MLSNQTKKKTVIRDVFLANSSFGRFKGLMFEKKERFDYALVFDFGSEKKWGASIHMLFVFFPITAVFLDANKRVVDIVRRLKPWTLNYTPKRPSRFLVELPREKHHWISMGDRLDWKKSV